MEIKDLEPADSPEPPVYPPTKVGVQDPTGTGQNGVGDKGGRSIVGLGVLGGPPRPLVHRMAANADRTDAAAAGGW